MSQDKVKNKISTLKEAPQIKWPSSETGGVLPMSIKSRFDDERHRLSEDFNEKWKQYRIKYIKSIVLTEKKREASPELYKMTHNIIRRAYRWPFNLLESKVFTPIMGKTLANKARKTLVFSVWAYAGLLFSYYKLVYGPNINNWEINNRITGFSERPLILPGDKNYPLKNPKPYNWQFYDNGFSKRKVFLDV